MKRTLAVAAAALAAASFAAAANPSRPALRVTAVTELDGPPSSLAVTADAAWASIGLGGIVRIDRATNRPTATIRPGGVVIGLAAGFGSIWAIDVVGDRLLRIDPDTATMTRETGVGGLPNGIAVGHGSIWVQNQLDSTVLRIDPATGRATATIAFAPDELWPDSILATPDAIWVVTGFGNAVSRIDASSARVTTEIPVLGARSLAFARGSLWVGRAQAASVARIGRKGIGYVDLAGPRTDSYGPELGGGSELWLARRGSLVRLRPQAAAFRLPQRHHISAVVAAGDVWVADQTASRVLRLGR
jgi:streptogramin lyase